MSFRLRLMLVLLVIYAVGGYFLVRQSLAQIRPRYLESMEESLVDVTVLLAAIVEEDLGAEGQLDPTRLASAVAAAQSREFEARIFSLRKRAVDLRVLVVAADGRVVFDSTGQHVGDDFSQWRDIARTLRGEYGARSTRDVPGDDSTQVLYVAAPLRRDGEIVGAVSVGKPTFVVSELVEAAKKKLLVGALMGGLALLGSLLLVASWVTAPLERLTQYARQLRDGQRVTRPVLPGRTLRDLGVALEELRAALDGRQHVERYTQSLAHEIKAPLAAIRGAAELIEEGMPAEQRLRFVGNIRREAQRIHQIIERLLELSSLEARRELARLEDVELKALMEEAVEVIHPACSASGVDLQVELPRESVRLRGERVLLREALVNLLQNALEFSPRGARVGLRVEISSAEVSLVVEDEGPGVPDYALDRIFERFYSLPRPGSARKSTGLGLSLVREIAHLHEGEATVTNRPPGGAQARLRLPRVPAV